LVWGLLLNGNAYASIVEELTSLNNLYKDGDDLLGKMFPTLHRLN